MFNCLEERQLRYALKKEGESLSALDVAAAISAIEQDEYSDTKDFRVEDSKETKKVAGDKHVDAATTAQKQASSKTSTAKKSDAISSTSASGTVPAFHKKEEGISNKNVDPLVPPRGTLPTSTSSSMHAPQQSAGTTNAAVMPMSPMGGHHSKRKRANKGLLLQSPTHAAISSGTSSALLRITDEDEKGVENEEASMKSTKKMIDNAKSNGDENSSKPGKSDHGQTDEEITESTAAGNNKRKRKTPNSNSSGDARSTTAPTTVAEEVASSSPVKKRRAITSASSSASGVKEDISTSIAIAEEDSTTRATQRSRSTRHHPALVSITPFKDSASIISSLKPAGQQRVSNVGSVTAKATGTTTSISADGEQSEELNEERNELADSENRVEEGGEFRLNEVNKGDTEDVIESAAEVYEVDEEAEDVPVADRTMDAADDTTEDEATEKLPSRSAAHRVSKSIAGSSAPAPHTSISFSKPTDILAPSSVLPFSLSAPSNNAQTTSVANATFPTAAPRQHYPKLPSEPYLHPPNQSQSQQQRHFTTSSSALQPLSSPNLQAPTMQKSTGHTPSMHSLSSPSAAEIQMRKDRFAALAEAAAARSTPAQLHSLQQLHPHNTSLRHAQAQAHRAAQLSNSSQSVSSSTPAAARPVATTASAATASTTKSSSSVSSSAAASPAVNSRSTNPANANTPFISSSTIGTSNTSSTSATHFSAAVPSTTVTTAEAAVPSTTVTTAEAAAKAAAESATPQPPPHLQVQASSHINANNSAASNSTDLTHNNNNNNNSNSISSHRRRSATSHNTSYLGDSLQEVAARQAAAKRSFSLSQTLSQSQSSSPPPPSLSDSATKRSRLSSTIMSNMHSASSVSNANIHTQIPTPHSARQQAPAASSRSTFGTSPYASSSLTTVNAAANVHDDDLTQCSASDSIADFDVDSKIIAHSDSLRRSRSLPQAALPTELPSDDVLSPSPVPHTLSQSKQVIWSARSHNSNLAPSSANTSATSSALKTAQTTTPHQPHPSYRQQLQQTQFTGGSPTPRVALTSATPSSSSHTLISQAASAIRSFLFASSSSSKTHTTNPPVASSSSYIVEDASRGDPRDDTAEHMPGLGTQTAASSLLLLSSSKPHNADKRHVDRKRIDETLIASSGDEGNGEVDDVDSDEEFEFTTSAVPKSSNKRHSKATTAKTGKQTLQSSSSASKRRHLGQTTRESVPPHKQTGMRRGRGLEVQDSDYEDLIRSPDTPPSRSRLSVTTTTGRLKRKLF